jgi:hypothetical protein
MVLQTPMVARTFRLANNLHPAIPNRNARADVPVPAKGREGTARFSHLVRRRAKVSVETILRYNSYRHLPVGGFILWIVTDVSTGENLWDLPVWLPLE